MSGYNIGPKIGIDGEKEFRESIRALNTEYKTLEAQTKALTAEFEANGDEIGKLTAHSEQLEKQIDVQKRKMSQLEDAVSKATAMYGENSVEANRLKGALFDTQGTLANLEGELKDTKSQLEKAASGMEEFGEEADDASNAALDFGDILNANLISDALMDGLEKAVDLIVEFGKGSLEAAANVNAASSQFEQTFGDLESTAQAALESISKDTNIATTRMQSSFTQLYAFSKTAGADSDKALDLASRAMIAAADNAAYYDKTIEEATESLQSFLKGNYANDAALGISATETTRNAKANELYATSFDNLSESQKVDVLLAMVEAGNAASGAIGQAARESDAWANVTGELDEALTQMQATLGQPALKAATPIIREITNAIYDLIEVQDWKVLDEDMKSFVNTMKDADAQFESTTKQIESNAFAADWYINRLQELEVAGLSTAESQYEYAAIVEQLNSLIPDLNLVIDEQAGLIKQNADAIRDDIQAWKDQATAQAMQDKMTDKVEAYAEAEAALYEAKAKLTILEQEQADIERQLAESADEATQKNGSFFNALDALSGLLGSASADAGQFVTMYQHLGTSAEIAGDPVLQLQKQLTENQIAQENLTREIGEAESVLGEYSDEVTASSEALSLYESETDSVAESQDDLSGKIQEVEQRLRDIQDAYSDAKDSARDSIDSQIGLFDELATESEMSAAEIIENWKKQQEAFYNYTVNMQKAVDMGLDQTLVQQLADGSEQSMIVLNELVNSTDTKIGEINAAFRGLSDAKDTTSSIMAEIATGAKSAMDEVTAEARNWGVYIVDGAVAGISANAYRFANAMSDLGKVGNSAFCYTLEIQSPSRVMMDDSEDTVAGAVIGVEKNLSKFEASMAELATAGDTAFLNERLTAAELYPSVMEIPTLQNTTTENKTVSYGGFTFNIYQQPGESAEELMERMQEIVAAKEAGL